MKNKKILITLKIPTIAKELLKEDGFQVSTWENEEPIERSEIIKMCKRHDAIISSGIYKIDRDFLRECKHLDIISQYAGGYDNVDVPAAKDLDVVLANTPGTRTEATADMAFAWMLGVARKMF